MFTIEKKTPADEKNERVRDTVRKKVVEYMARAEKIKEHLAKLEEKPKKKAMANSSNGKGNKYVQDSLRPKMVTFLFRSNIERGYLTMN